MLTKRLERLDSIKIIHKIFAVYAKYPTQIKCKHCDCTIICSFDIRFEVGFQQDTRKEAEGVSEREIERVERATAL